MIPAERAQKIVDELVGIVHDQGLDDQIVKEVVHHIDQRFDRLERAIGNDLLWSLETTCEQLGGVSDDYVRALADQGLIERRYQGRRPFFTARSVRAYVDSLPSEPGGGCSQ